MKLYLVRHAIAEDRSTSGSDADRALSAEGKARMRQAAAGLAALDTRIDRILTSPFRRARETAEILATALGAVEVEELDELAAGADPRRLSTALRRHRELPSLALVGHQPDLGLFASQILTGSADLCLLPFKKGAVACFEIDDALPDLRGSLGWFLAPAQLRAIAAR